MTYLAAYGTPTPRGDLRDSGGAEYLYLTGVAVLASIRADNGRTRLRN